MPLWSLTMLCGQYLIREAPSSHEWALQAVPAWGKEWKVHDLTPRSPEHQQGYYLQGFWTSDQPDAEHFRFGQKGKRS